MPNNNLFKFLFLLNVILILILTSQFSFAQKGGNLADCKKWVKQTLTELPKGDVAFATKYFRTPFLSGIGADAYYTYDRSSTKNELNSVVKKYFTSCIIQLKKGKGLTITEVSVSESTLPYLCNSYEYKEVDGDGNRSFPNEPVPYAGLVNEGDQVFIVSSPCGPKIDYFDYKQIVELFIIFDVKSRTYKYWAANKGL